MTPIKAVAVFTLLFLGASVAGVAASADQSGPTVSRALAKPLKAAQDAMQAKNWDAVLSNLKEAQSAAGEKSAYDNFVINQMLGFAYVQVKAAFRVSYFHDRPKINFFSSNAKPKY